LELRSKPATRKRPGSIEKDASSENIAFDPSSLPYIDELIAHGQITIGITKPAGCVAIAADGPNTLAMLVRREKETLNQLLTRLDLAIARAFVEDIFTDEVNSRPQKI
jgi:hypothetical protein